MAEYIENVAGQTAKLDWAFPFQRTGQFPIDRSILFSSYEDAVKYASGQKDENGDPLDSRKLGGTSYVGQVITVYTTDVGVEGEDDYKPAEVTVYTIAADRTLQEVGKATNGDGVSIDLNSESGVLSIHGFGTAGADTIPQKNADGTIHWVKVSDVVEGDTNTITDGDNKSIVTSDVEIDGVDRVLEIAGYSDATVGQIPSKTVGGTAWIDVYTKEQANVAISEAIRDSQHLKKEVITKSQLDAFVLAPETADVNTIYLYKSVLDEGFVYEQWGVVEADGAKTFVELGDTSVELTGYATENYVDNEIAKAVEALDVTVEGMGAGKTIATLTETDGKIAATFQDIAITASQVSDFDEVVASLLPEPVVHKTITFDDGDAETTNKTYDTTDDITITASTLGAYTKVEVDTELNKKANSTELNNVKIELQGKVDVVDGKVTTNAQAIVDLQVADNTLQDNIDAKVAQSDYDSKISVLEKADSDNSTAIAGINGEISTIKSDATTLTGRVTANENTIALKADKSVVDGHTTVIEEHQVAISKNATDIATEKGRIDSLIETVGANKTAADKTATDLATLTTTVENNKNSADQTQEDLEVLETYVGAIPTGYTETNVIAYINKKAEETLNVANSDLSESVASVIQALETYKVENDPKVEANTQGIADNKVAIETLSGKVGTIEYGTTVVDMIATALNDAKEYADANDTNATYTINYDSDTQEIVLVGANGGETTKISASAFIKDGMLDKAEYNAETNEIVLTWNTEAGKEAMEIDLNDLVDTYTGSDAIDVSTDGVISIKENSVAKAMLTEVVQTSLNKADTALQEHQDISHLATTEAMNQAIVTATTDMETTAGAQAKADGAKSSAVQEANAYTDGVAEQLLNDAKNLDTAILSEAQTYTNNAITAAFVWGTF